MRVNGMPPVHRTALNLLPEQRLIQTGHPDDDEHGGTDVDWLRDTLHTLNLMQNSLNTSKSCAVRKVV
jgi:hypothetical protein